MMIHDMLEAIKLFIILNPMECLVTGIIIFTWTGSYLESVFKFWDWGPQCQDCEEWHLYSDSVILCTKCDEYKCNGEWAKGYTQSSERAGELQ